MLIRKSDTLVFTPENGEFTVFNFLTKSIFNCPASTVDFISQLDDWNDIEQAVGLMPNISDSQMHSNIRSLIDVTAIIEANSDQDKQETEFLQAWGWGTPAAMFHFSLSDKEFLSSDQIEEAQKIKAATVPSPKLFLKNDDFREVVQLASAIEGNDLLQLMSRRRTVREAQPTAVTVRELTDCLFAGMGITGHTHNCVGELPLSMTPSGGARNPIEAFVYAINVEGLPKGFYHYSALENSLGKLPTNKVPMPSQLLAGQEWSDDMPCIIFLAAYYERSMWKYTDPNAYRGVLIEAGHIGQNVMLAATQHTMTACPTAAFCHSLLHECLGLKGSTESAVYALALAHPKVDNSSIMYH